MAYILKSELLNQFSIFDRIFGFLLIFKQTVIVFHSIKPEEL